MAVVKFPEPTKVALDIFHRRYQHNGETFHGMLKRVAEYIAKPEQSKDKDKWADTFFTLMASLRFLPNSPTLFNAGTDSGLLSACFMFVVDDSLNSIMECHRLAGLVQKYGGGVGYALSRVRPRDSDIKSVHGKACGPVSLIKYYNSLAELITQGGRRAGAQMGILSVDHPDILSFIHCKDENPDSLSTFNISVAITDDFMAQYVTGDPYARRVMQEISESAWKTGDPGVFFIDTVNKFNPTPWLGRLEGTNPCFEGNTLIATSEGMLPIKDTPGAWLTGIKPIYRIKTEEGYEVYATADHKFYTESGWQSLKNLKNSSSIRICETPAFGNDGDKDLGYVLGWLSGDGHINRYDRSILYFAEPDKTEAYPIISEAYENIFHKIHASRSGTQTRIRSMKLTDLVMLWKPVDKFPERMLTATEDCQKAYLSALFSADGCIIGTQRKGVSVRLSSSKLHLLKRVQLLLRNFNIYSRIYENRRLAGFTELPDQHGGLKEYYCDAQHELVISNASLKVFADKIGFIIKAKQNKLLERLASYKRRLNQDRVWARVKSIEYSGDAEVWDVSTPTLSLSANGLLAHNCGEVPLLHGEACNLGSLNLSRYIMSDKDFNWNLMKSDIEVAVRMLDNIISVNKFPDPVITDAVKKTRKIGLGVMGWADALALLEIDYDSNEAISTGIKIMKFISEHANEASSHLADERGLYEAAVDRESESGVYYRNATRTCIAPTGSISQLAGCSSGIEPHPMLEYTRNMYDRGNIVPLQVREPVLDLLKQLHIDFTPKIAHEISPEWHVRHQAAFQQYTDLAVSKTINMPNNATAQDIEQAYVDMYNTGCKGGTVYRDGSRKAQVLDSLVEVPAVNIVVSGIYTDSSKQSKPETNGRSRLPAERQSITHKFCVGDQEGYITVGLYNDGTPGELFIKISKEGSTIAGLMDAVAIMTSISLQYHVPLESICNKMVNSRFEPSGMTGNPAIPIATSIVDYVFRWMRYKFIHTEYSELKTGLFCPDCNAEMIAQEGCLRCISCGYTKCG